MKKRLSAWIVLGVITVVAGLCLGVTNEVTKEPIAEQAILTAEAARRQVLPLASAFMETEVAPESGLDNCYAGTDGETPVGYVAQVTVQGFGGPVEVIVGMDAGGAITGVSVGGSSFSETAGLGAKSKDALFRDQFIGKTAPLRVIKAGGEETDNTIDAITAATITSSAVTGAVNKACAYMKTLLSPAQGEAEPEAQAEGRVSTASKKGYGGPVAVTVTFGDTGEIYAMTVGNENFAESDGIGSQVKDEWFIAQFIGKSAPLEETDVDLITGATYSSTAVVKAINAAWEKLQSAE